MKGIKRSRALVLLFSASANGSNHIVRELQQAEHLGIPVIRFALDDSEMSDDIQYLLSVTQWFNSPADDFETKALDLAKYLCTSAFSSSSDVATGARSEASASTERPVVVAAKSVPEAKTVMPGPKPAKGPAIAITLLSKRKLITLLGLLLILLLSVLYVPNTSNLMDRLFKQVQGGRQTPSVQWEKPTSQSFDITKRAEALIEKNRWGDAQALLEAEIAKAKPGTNVESELKLLGYLYQISNNPLAISCFERLHKSQLNYVKWCQANGSKIDGLVDRQHTSIQLGIALLRHGNLRDLDRALELISLGRGYSGLWSEGHDDPAIEIERLSASAILAERQQNLEQAEVQLEKLNSRLGVDGKYIKPLDHVLYLCQCAAFFRDQSDFDRASQILSLAITISDYVPVTQISFAQAQICLTQADTFYQQREKTKAEDVLRRAIRLLRESWGDLSIPVKNAEAFLAHISDKKQ